MEVLVAVTVVAVTVVKVTVAVVPVNEAVVVRDIVVEVTLEPAVKSRVCDEYSQNTQSSAMCQHTHNVQDR